MRPQLPGNSYCVSPTLPRFHNQCLRRRDRTQIAHLVLECHKSCKQQPRCVLLCQRFHLERTGLINLPHGSGSFMIMLACLQNAVGSFAKTHTDTQLNNTLFFSGTVTFHPTLLGLWYIDAKLDTLQYSCYMTKHVFSFWYACQDVWLGKMVSEVSE